jgi:hypothetical protein
MEKFSPEEQALVTAIYRRYKGNPTAFVLTNEEKAIAMKLIDVFAFDIKPYNAQVLYQGYALDIFLIKNSLERVIFGEESRNITELLQGELHRYSIKVLTALRKYEIRDDILANAAYIQLGISHNIIPSVWSVFQVQRRCSEAYKYLLEKKEQEDAANRY